MANKLKGKTVYQIYPISFCDGNSDGIGDIDGIISKLDYIIELGFKAIWLNSIYQSKNLDGGYDVTNFYKISKRFGNISKLKKLINEIHKRDMMFLMECIPGHASVYHKDFLESAKSTKNEYSDLFIWTDDPWCWYNDVPTIRGCFNRNGAYVINFFAHQAAFNFGYNEIKYPSWQIRYDDPRLKKTRDYVSNVMKYYLKLGVDGFRVDMADSLVKNDGFTKSATIWVWQQIRNELKTEFPDFVMTSEWCQPYQALAATFDSDFVLEHDDTFLHYLFRMRDENHNNIPLLHRYNEEIFKKFVDDVYFRVKATYNCDGELSLISGNHDTERLRNFLTEEEMKLAMLFLLTMPGVNYIYQGDEIGMKQDKSLPSIEGGFQRTGCRTPMRFDRSKNYGFSLSDNIYLPSNEDSPTVEDLRKDPKSIFNIVKDLIHIRNNTDELTSKHFAFVDNTHFSYDRSSYRVYINIKEDETTLVDLNEYEIIYTINDPEIIDNKLVINYHKGCLLKRK